MGRGRAGAQESLEKFSQACPALSRLRAGDGLAHRKLEKFFPASSRPWAGDGLARRKLEKFFAGDCPAPSRLRAGDGLAHRKLSRKFSQPRPDHGPATGWRIRNSRENFYGLTRRSDGLLVSQIAGRRSAPAIVRNSSPAVGRDKVADDFQWSCRPRLGEVPPPTPSPPRTPSAPGKLGRRGGGATPVTGFLQAGSGRFKNRRARVVQCPLFWVIRRARVVQWPLFWVIRRARVVQCPPSG